MVPFPAVQLSLKPALLLLLCSMLGWSCKPKEAATAAAPASIEKPVEDAKEAAKDQVGDDLPSDDDLGRNYSGLFRVEDGKYEFVPCDHPEKTYWVIGETERLLSLYESATRQGYAGQNVMANVNAILVPSTSSGGAGMASPYDAQLRVVSVRQVRPKNPRNVCVAYDYWANGNEPFWSLQVSEAEGVIEFGVLGQPTVRFDYVAPSVEGEGRLIRYFARGGEQRIKINITAEPCSDSIAGNLYSHTVEVAYAGQTYRGCANAGASKD